MQTLGSESSQAPSSQKKRKGGHSLYNCIFSGQSLTQKSCFWQINRPKSRCWHCSWTHSTGHCCQVTSWCLPWHVVHCSKGLKWCGVMGGLRKGYWPGRILPSDYPRRLNCAFANLCENRFGLALHSNFCFFFLLWVAPKLWFKLWPNDCCSFKETAWIFSLYKANAMNLLRCPTNAAE